MNFYFGFIDAIKILSPYGSTGSACQDHGFGSQGIQDTKIKIKIDARMH